MMKKAHPDPITITQITFPANQKRANIKSLQNAQAGDFMFAEKRMTNKLISGYFCRNS
jgi:hypothetical protein